MLLNYLLFALLVCFKESVGMRKIYNGTNAKITDYPYLVKIIIEFRSHRSHCTGSYVHPYFVLSAAHCVENVPRRTSIICCMGAEIADANHCKPRRRVSNANTLENIDICMLKLTKPFPLGPGVKVGPLPTAKIDLWELSKKPCYAIGWGRTEENVISKRLLVAEVNLTTLCDLTEKLCVMGKEGGACKGDSGSPLICNNTIIAVLNSGSSETCGETGVLYIYIRTDTAKKFIDGTIDSAIEGDYENGASKLKLHISVLYLVICCIGVGQTLV